MEDVIKILRDQGYDAEVCDVPVRFYDCGVKAGYPQVPGDFNGEYVMIPKSLCEDVSFRITVRGDSMVDAGMDHGDVLNVRATDYCSDGDVVVALLNGEATVKMYLTDENDRAWLMPHNDSYMPIEITDEDEFRVLGVVTGVTKRMKVNIKDSMRKLRHITPKRQTEITNQRIKVAVTAVIDKIVNNRMWYSVFRVLVDRGRYESTDQIASFVSDINEIFPENDFNLDAKDLSRMAVLSFAKPVALWEIDNAPVSGKRFYSYLSLARDFGRAL